MAKSRNVNKLLKELADIVRRGNASALRPTSHDEPNVKVSTQRQKRLNTGLRRFDKAVTTAFSAFGLDRENEDHQEQLLFWLAGVIFGGRGPGAPKVWKRKKLLELLSDIKAIKAARPGLTEAQYCKRLVTENPRYEGCKPDTLRRRLQEAKKLDAGQPAETPGTPQAAKV
jgi:hypothetical protein